MSSDYTTETVGYQLSISVPRMGEINFSTGWVTATDDPNTDVGSSPWTSETAFAYMNAVSQAVVGNLPDGIGLDDYSFAVIDDTVETKKYNFDPDTGEITFP